MAKHTIEIALSKEEADGLNSAYAEFHFAYGITLANWAGVERALFYWFYRATEMSETMARAIFYSARSFNGRAEMLEAAIAHNHTLVGDELAFIKSAIKRAWQYNSFRNRIAHGEPIMNIIELADPKAGKTSRSIDWSIVEGKSTKGPDPETDVSIDRLKNAAENFHRLQSMLNDALGKNKSHQKYLELVRELPNQADSRGDHNSSER